MKKVLLLFFAFILATQVLLAGFTRGKCGNSEPEPVATLPGIKKNENTANIFTGKTTNNAAGYTPGRQIQPENNLYRLEFATEKGLTLIGGNLADLLLQNTCLPLDLAAYEQFPNTQIEVLVNQQPIEMQATGLVATLRQIPAEQIKSIEISTFFLNNSNLTREASILIQVTQVK